ncbi:serine/threonine protein kinase [Arcanobacterium canis]
MERTEIGGYQLVERIGVGGMSTVYEAVDGGGTRVALKLLHPALSADPAARVRLKREVAMLQRVRGPYVAQILDAETDDTDVFIVTELIDGPTLDDDVAQQGVFTGDDLAQLSRELGQALESIHAQGVLHRDIKPSNVMLGRNGPVLIDFGISQLGDDLRLTQTGSLTHTPGWADPRVIRGSAPDELADWWSMAAVMAFAATGRPPFGRGNTSAVMNRVLAGEADLSGLPDRLVAVFRAALSPNESARLSYATLQKALEDDDFAPMIPVVESAERTDDVVVGGEEAVDAEPAPIVEPTAIVERPTVIEPPVVRESAPVVETTRVMTTPTEQPIAFSPRRPLVSYAPQGDDVPVPQPVPQQVPQPVPQQVPQPMPQWMKTPRTFPLFFFTAGTTLALIGGVYPWVTMFAMVAVFWCADIVGDTREELHDRRYRHGGPYAGESVRSVLRLPWVMVTATLRLLMSVLVGGGIAMGVGWVMTRMDVARSRPLYSAVVGLAIVLIWTFAASRKAREGSRYMMESVTPTSGYRALWVVFAIAAAAGAFVFWGSGTTVNLAPIGRILF